MSTLEKLLQTYEGHTGLSIPLVMRKAYGKRLHKIRWLCSSLAEHGVCSLDHAHLLSYQLVLEKLRWRKARSCIAQAHAATLASPGTTSTILSALFQQLSELVDT
ncbi:hypothetical protein BH11PAT4_BH11PAT4_3590 [soil metagenome]